MLVYWLTWGLAAAGIVAREFVSPAIRNGAWILYGLLLILFVGLRHEVGGDWSTYLDYVHRAAQMSFLEGLEVDDVGYAAVNWLGAHTPGGIYFVNFVCAVIAVTGLMIFCARQRDPGLALLVAIPYLVVVVFLGYSRQSAAIGFGLLALLAVIDGKQWRFLLWVTLATLFHKSALVFFLFAPALYSPRISRRDLLKLALMAAYALALAYVLLVPRLGWFWNSYVTISLGTVEGPALISSPTSPVPLAPSSSVPPPASAPQAVLPAPELVVVDDSMVYSRGAQLRLGIGMLAAALIGVLVARKLLTGRAAWAWTIGSACVVGLFVLALFKSTLADRFGLYFIPLQSVAFSMVPLLFVPGLRRAAEIAIVLGTGALLGGWLFMADNAPSWLPYGNLLLWPNVASPA
jgi:hypothetical protein